MGGKREETFIQRWSQKKIQSAESANVSIKEATQPDGEALHPVSQEDPEGRELTDADMPDLDSLNDGSSYADFLSSGVSEALRRKALHKLFHAATYNICDGLDDYAEDYTTFEKLGDVITADMRHRMNMEEERKRAESAQDTDGAVAEDTDSGAADENNIVTDDPGPDATAQAVDEESKEPSGDREDDDPHPNDAVTQSDESSGEPHV